jgi:hypothetical protein
MSRKKKTEQQGQETVTEPAEQYSAPEAPVEQRLSIEQVALMHGSKFSPPFKSHHMKSILSFCASTGASPEGSEEELLKVLKAYGYKI